MYEDLLEKFNLMTKTANKINKILFINTELYKGEFFTLMTIDEYCKNQKTDVAGIKPSVLSKEMGASVSATSKLIRSVENKGYIERNYCKNDKRVVYISLTEKGRMLLDKLQKKRHDFLISVIDRIGKKKMEEFLDIGEEFINVMLEMETKEWEADKNV